MFIEVVANLLLLAVAIWGLSAYIVLSSLISRYPQQWKDLQSKKYPWLIDGSKTRLVAYLWDSVLYFRKRNKVLFSISIVGNISFILLVPVLMYSLYFLILNK